MSKEMHRSAVGELREVQMSAEIIDFVKHGGSFLEQIARARAEFDRFSEMVDGAVLCELLSRQPVNRLTLEQRLTNGG